MVGFSNTTQIYTNYYHNLPQFTTLLINCCFFAKMEVARRSKIQKHLFENKSAKPNIIFFVHLSL
mgnify:CR=1 FL=1